MESVVFYLYISSYKSWGLILKTHIDNYLEILLEKIDKAIACYERVTDLIIQNQEWTKKLTVLF